jgi:inosine/xanthosine triphosphate pyrophosphatase family protein
MCDFDEGRFLDIRDITRYKLQQAKNAFPNKPHLVVEDTGFLILALNGFPGPYVKYFLSTIGVDRLLTLMQSEPDKTAIFRTVLGYFDGKKDYFFSYDETEFILDRKSKNTDIKGWTEILTIYGHHPYIDKSLSELSQQEYEHYHSIVEKEDTISQLIQFMELE